MAPLPTALDIPDLDARSATISAADLPAYLSSLSLPEREALAHPRSSIMKRNAGDADSLSPRSILTARAPRKSIDPASGSVPPESINMKGIQTIFALIGVVFVLGGIWFFFWAKNGGFQWRKGDWEDYKSTVLRRKGPNGTTLSNATKSTKLGGGSVVGDGYSDNGATETMTELSSEAPIISEKRKQSKQKQKETAKERKIREEKGARWEGGADEDVRAYRHERVAKVGGLNRDSDAQFYGTDYSDTDPSVTHHYSRHTPSGTSPEKRASSARRDVPNGRDTIFVRTGSPQRSSRYHSPSKGARASMPGSYVDPLDFDAQSQGTRSYHHPIPGLSGNNRAAADGGGYRRDRRDSLDSD